VSIVWLRARIPPNSTAWLPLPIGPPARPGAPGIQAKFDPTPCWLPQHSPIPASLVQQSGDACQGVLLDSSVVLQKLDNIVVDGMSGATVEFQRS